MLTAPIESIQARYSQLDGHPPILRQSEAVEMVTSLLDEGYEMVAGMLITDRSMTLRGLIGALRVNTGDVSVDPSTVVGPYAFLTSVMLDGSIGLWTRNTAAAA